VAALSAHATRVLFAQQQQQQPSTRPETMSSDAFSICYANMPTWRQLTASSSTEPHHDARSMQFMHTQLTLSKVIEYNADRTKK
jgi:hypothetical protein